MLSPMTTSQATATRRHAWRWVLLAVVGLLYCTIGVRGLTGPWHWGHNGYNGAAFSQAAKNSARFGIVGQAPYHYDREPPQASEIYTHHPMALHAHLVASFALFGTHEWAARLVPFLYSLATWLLLMFAVRRYWGDRTALLAGLVYALTPLNLIFANMVNHEQGGIFACLLLLYAYLRWFETGGRLHTVLCAVAVTLAVQFDWPGYYVAFAIATHCLLTGVRGTAPPGWRSFIGGFSAVTLANMLAFFGWIYVTRSGLDEMAEAFQFRSQTPSAGGYVMLLVRRLLLLHGPILLGAAGIGTVGSFLTHKGRPLPQRALLPLAFLFAGSIQVLVFPQAAQLHSYWIYYWSPALAIAAALGLGLVIERTEMLQDRSRSVAVPKRWIEPLVVLLFVATQGSLALSTWHEQLDHGHAADCDDCYFQSLERLWFTALDEHFDRSTARFAIHRSVREPRTELHYYLDAPHRTVERVYPVAADEVLLLDLNNLGRGERNILPYLSRTYPTVVWMNRFYAIDSRSTETKMTRFDVVEDDPSFLRWWLTTQTSGPPLRWERVP